MKTKFIKIFTQNIGLKLISLILAIALWFFVISGGRSEIIIDVPIQFKNMPQGLELIDSYKTVSINIGGQERLLKNLKPDDIGIFIDMSKVEKGETYFPLSKENIKLPTALTIAKISPNRVKLVVEETLKKTVPIKPIIVGSPAEGFSISNVEITPKMVAIEGPTGVIVRIYSVKTRLIDITGLTEDFQYNVPLNIPEGNIRVSITEVKVNVAVEKGKIKGGRE